MINVTDFTVVIFVKIKFLSYKKTPSFSEMKIVIFSSDMKPIEILTLFSSSKNLHRL